MRIPKISHRWTQMDTDKICRDGLSVAARRDRVHLWLNSLLAALVVATGVNVAQADKPVAVADLAVDQVSLKGGPRLLGAVLGREADGTIAFAVGRVWLKKTHAKYFEQALRDETAQTRAAFTELCDRIAEWRKVRGADKELEFFLGKESERVEKELKALDAGTREEDAAFLVLDLARRRKSNGL